MGGTRAGFPASARWKPQRLAALLVAAAALVAVLVYGALKLRESLIRGNEAQARQTLRVITEALQAYQKKHGGYPDALERLRGKQDGNPGTAPPERARLLETELARDKFEKNGYLFRFRPVTMKQSWAATVHLVARYRLTAQPSSPGSSDEWFYFTDQNGEIHARQGEAASPDDPVVPSN